MSGDDNIFARWSRRKQAERHGKAPVPDEEQGVPEAAAIEAVPVEQPAVEEADAVEPLPSLEDLTAESDLSAFLRKGVPQALKSAALRKMWSLDPAIRDFVGPSEYAWDFNQPGSMAGFGALDAREAVVDFLSKMGGEEQAGPQSAPGDASEPSSPQIAEVSSEQDEGALSEDRAEAAPAAHDPAGAEQPPANSVEPATGPAEADEPSPAAAPRRHGGAVPR